MLRILYSEHSHYISYKDNKFTMQGVNKIPIFMIRPISTLESTDKRKRKQIKQNKILDHFPGAYFFVDTNKNTNYVVYLPNIQNGACGFMILDCICAKP